MADQNTGMEVYLNLVANKKSVQTALTEIEKDTVKAFKDGCIEIPLKTITSTDTAKDLSKLNKAQEDLLNHWNKRSEKGFSASVDYVEELIEKYKQFKALAGAKGANMTRNSQVQNITKIIGGQLQPYIQKTGQLKADLAKIESKLKTYNDKGIKIAIKKSKNPRNFGPHSKEDIEGDIKKEQYRGIKSVLPKGFSKNRRPNAVATPNTANMAEWSGPYEVPANRQPAESLKIARATYEKLSLKKYSAEGEKLNQLIDAAKQGNLKLKELVITKHSNGQMDRQFVDVSERGHTKKEISEQQKASEKANLVANKAAETLSGIERGKDYATPEDFKTFTKSIDDYTKLSGKSDWDTMRLTIDKVMHRYHNVDGSLGLGRDNIKGEGIGHEEATKVLSELMDTFTTTMKDSEVALKAYEGQQRKILAKLKAWKDLENLDKGISSTKETKKTKANKDNSLLVKEIKGLQEKVNDTTRATAEDRKAVEKQTRYDLVENSAERVADNAAGKKTENLIKATQEDSSSGFNTNDNAMAAITAIEGLGNSLKDAMCPCKDILESIFTEVKVISQNKVSSKSQEIEGTRVGSSTLIPISDVKDIPIETEDAKPTVKFGMSELEERAKYANANAMTLQNKINEDIGNDIINHIKNLEVTAKDDSLNSKISTTVKDPYSWITKLKDAFAELTHTTANYKTIMAKTSKEQDDMSAERIRKYGLTRGNNPADSGDKIMIARRLSLFKGKDIFKQLFKEINLSKGIEIDTTEITNKLAKALSGKEMFKAQTGGWRNNILGALTGGLSFAFTPSLEKSRSQAEGVNQIMANIRKAMNDVLQDIQTKESTLRGMRASGDLQLGENGEVLETSTKAAKALALQLEESKEALASILADAGETEQVVKRTHGRIGKMIKQLGFTSPMLRKNNAILANLNAGLDKSGKALKYQRRMAELLSYSFRLMARHAGQIVKNLLLQLNPLTQIKKLFKDFMSYDVKWQRTMNVIKYNLRTIFKPAMEWIAQKLVNVIGFFDIISMKIQEAFGNIPISVFDQAAADAEKMNEEISNVSAGFDELHDIGSENTGANDLFGDIYKPELSQEWIDLANRIGDLFGKLIKGDLGFGEVMKEILGILGDTLGKIGKAIWDWFKETDLGKWLIENWKKLLDNLLKIFTAWKLLKLLGKLLWGSVESAFTRGAVTALLNKIFGWVGTGLRALGTLLVDALASTQFGSDMIRGFKGMFTSGGMIGAFKSGGASLGTIFAQALVAVAGALVAGFGAKIAGDMIASDTDYNSGVRSVGGSKKDEKDSTGAYVTSALSGAVGGGMIGLAVGGPVGAAIGATLGAIANVVNTSLVPGFEELAIQIKEATNQLQNMSFYEGAVDAASNKVSSLTELTDLLTQAFEKQTEKLYAEGDSLGISRERMDELIDSVKDGTYNTDMLNGSEQQLAGSLDYLANLSERNKSAADRLTEAKKKLAKAEMDLAIAQDIEAGNFELAAARIEVAYASEVYTLDDATKKMIQILKKGSDEQKKEILQDLSPDIKKNFSKYVTTYEEGKNDICEIFNQMTSEAQEAFSQDYADEARAAMNRTLQALQQTINSSNIFSTISSSLARIQKEQLINAAKKKGIDLAYYDTGTSYVPNNGLAYLHKGEAVIPADQNVFAAQGEAFNAQSLTNSRLESAIMSLSAQLKQGINVNGEFRQRGSDLVATVNKNKSQTGADLLSNVAYAR